MHLNEATCSGAQEGTGASKSQRALHTPGQEPVCTVGGRVRRHRSATQGMESPSIVHGPICLLLIRDQKT